MWGRFPRSPSTTTRYLQGQGQKYNGAVAREPTSFQRLRYPRQSNYQLDHLVHGNRLGVFINIYENMDCVLTLPIPNFLVDVIQELDVMPSQTSSSKGELHTSLTQFLLGPKGLAPPSRSWGSTLMQLPTTGLSDSPEPRTLLLSQLREGRSSLPRWPHGRTRHGRGS